MVAQWPAWSGSLCPKKMSNYYLAEVWLKPEGTKERSETRRFDTQKEAVGYCLARTREPDALRRAEVVMIHARTQEVDEVWTYHEDKKV